MSDERFEQFFVFLKMNENIQYSILYVHRQNNAKMPSEQQPVLIVNTSTTTKTIKTKVTLVEGVASSYAHVKTATVGSLKKTSSEMNFKHFFLQSITVFF